MTRGQRAIKWIEKFCVVPSGKSVGKPVKLEPFQKDLIIRIYDNPAGTRRAIVSFGRKNGKTALSAFLLLLHLAGPEAIVNGELYSAAQSLDQAAILFKLASQTVRLSPQLSEHIVIRDHLKQLLCPALGTTYSALSADARTKLGSSPVFVIHDELGQVRGPKSDLYEALETGVGAQENPLSIVISTQAASDNDLLSVLIDDALRGEDPRIVVCLYTAPKEDDPFSESTIKKANPAFDVFLNAKEVLQQAKEASRMPSREASYRNLILNQRVETYQPFIGQEVWRSCGGPIDVELFESGAPVYGGLDLSSTTDLCALSLVCFDSSNVAHAMSFAWTPKDTLLDRAHKDRAPYDVWVNQGFLRTTPGKAVDYEIIAQEIIDIVQSMNLVTIGYDRWRISIMKKAFSNLGVEMPLKEFGQGFKDMSPAVDRLESLLLQKRLLHGNNPVLTLGASSSIIDTDPAGNRKVTKAKSRGRIDALVALLIAVGTANIESDDQSSFDSVYELGVI